MTFQQINLPCISMYSWYRLHRVICYCLRLAIYLKYILDSDYLGAIPVVSFPKFLTPRRFPNTKTKCPGCSALSSIEQIWWLIEVYICWHAACGLSLSTTNINVPPTFGSRLHHVHGHYGTEALNSLQDAEGNWMNPVTACSGSSARRLLSV